MKIKVLGTGCPSCQQLEKNVKEAIDEMKLEAEFQKITDMEEILSYGVMSLPAVVVDKRVISYGSVPTVKEIKGLLVSADDSSDCCSKKCNCKGGCC